MGVPWKNDDKTIIYFLVSLPSPCTLSFKQWTNLGIISAAQWGRRAEGCLPDAGASGGAVSSSRVPPHAAHLHGTSHATTAQLAPQCHVPARYLAFSSGALFPSRSSQDLEKDWAFKDWQGFPEQGRKASAVLLYTSPAVWTTAGCGQVVWLTIIYITVVSKQAPVSGRTLVRVLTGSKFCLVLLCDLFCSPRGDPGFLCSLPVTSVCPWLCCCWQTGWWALLFFWLYLAKKTKSNKFGLDAQAEIRVLFH